MKRSGGLIFFLAVLSLISGYLLSKASLAGRIGMSLVYREYNFLKTWWKGGLLVFIVLMALLEIQGLLHKKLTVKQAHTMHLVALALAVAGLYFTYNDFRHSLSHRMLGERFHIGAYLFWTGWISISCYYLYQEAAGNSAERAALVEDGKPARVMEGNKKS